MGATVTRRYRADSPMGEVIEPVASEIHSSEVKPLVPTHSESPDLSIFKDPRREIALRCTRSARRAALGSAHRRNRPAAPCAGP